MQLSKEELVKLKDESEAHCNDLYAQLQTLQQQGQQLEVELERSRGDFRTYSSLIARLEENPKAKKGEQ